MVAALKDTLLEESRRPAVIADAQGVVDAEVAGKKGASGLAVKGGYAAVKKVSPSIVPDAIESLLPKFSEQLEPYWAEFRNGGTGSFGDFLAARSDKVSDSLLSVTDARIEASSRPALKKVYSSMRSSAKKHVIEALPRVGALVEKHA